MSRAFVTGASGQDGSYLVERLLDEGWEVAALTRPLDSAAHPDSPAVPSAVRRCEGDLRNPARLAEIIDEVEPDVVFNLAGISSVALSWEQPVLTAQVTGVAVAALLDASLRVQERRGMPVRFVQASSSEIFGSARENPQDETTPINPVSPYGAAKAFAHHQVRVYRGRGLLASNAILYNHESPRRPRGFVTRKITSGVAAIAAGTADTLTLGNLDARRDWGWAPDYVDALVRAARAAEGDDYIVATGRSHTVREFVDAAFRSAGITAWEQHLEVDERFNRPVDAPEMRGDASRAMTRLGWKPTVGFEEIVARMTAHDLGLTTDR